MTIGPLAKASEVDAQTIRFYERQGLLEKPERSVSNYRVYGDDAVARLRFIRRAKGVGFSLNDIKILLSMADGKLRRCADVRDFAETRLTKIRAQIKDLCAVENTLSALVQQCSRSARITECPIFEALSEER